MRFLAALLPVVFLLGSLTSCSSFYSEPDSPEKPKLTPEEQAKLDELASELEIGRNMAGRLLEFYGQYSDESLTNYINQVGSYVGKYSSAPERKYMFAVLDTDAINAFACPGGYILITLGTIRNVRTEAELAAILGHEVTHVAKQHMYNTLKAMDKKEVEKTASALAKTPEQDIAQSRQRPSANEETWLGTFLAKYLTGPTSAGLNLLEAAKAGMSLILEKGLDHKLEFQADQEGVKIASNAGYDPYAMLRFLKRLYEEKSKTKLNMHVLEKTHPKLSERSQQIAALLTAMDVKNIIGAKGEARLLENLKNIRPAKKDKA